MRRVCVIGVTGTGKSTLAAALAAKLRAEHVDLDRLHWGANWTMTELGVFRERVAGSVRQERWVVDGNYSKVRDLVWPRADCIVWLDYAFPVAFTRLLRRTIRRLWRREVLWNGNREQFRVNFLSRESLFLWLRKTHREYRAAYPELLASEPYRHIAVVRLRTPSAAKAWLDGL